MDQQSYLQRLRSIREKYGCRDVAPYSTPYGETSYLKIDFHNPEYQHPFRGAHGKFPSKPAHNLQGTERGKLLLARQVEKTQIRVPRSFSVSQKPIQASRKDNHFNEAQLKRQENFMSFIKDLDTRIQQKQKMLNMRFKDNQAIIKKTEIYNQVQNKNLQRYNSHKDLRMPVNFNERMQQMVPRTSLQKNSEFLNKKGNCYENRQNDASLRTQASSGRKKYNQLSNIIRQPENSLHTSPSLLLQKKLEKNQVINKEGWNSNKLQNIQQRIKSVLKHCNN